ncbi:acyltransferase [Chlorobium sp. N1]|uniref:acyltransferase n=1 Tax=Chlorobium sp. N1 TaxID=2491138 RepID=UPI00103AF12E|nr:acyltransferase [Chlorobium sp. N1]TCD46991.1 acyltransferase [Chlorobium sp. N1]
MSYYSCDELVRMGFQNVGKNVLVSTKASIYNCDSVSIGEKSRIDDYCVISGNVTIGKHVHLAAGCLVAGGEKGVCIEDFAGLAYHVMVFSQSDDYSGMTLTNPTVPDEYKRERKLRVVLGRHVIVGAGSIVFPGVSIAEGCAIGALSLLQDSTEPWGVYAGRPAVRVNERRRKLLELEAGLLLKDE